MSRIAMLTFTKLPLVSKPVGTGGDAEHDLSSWRQWYEQVKAGKRTFRFVGDPTE